MFFSFSLEGWLSFWSHTHRQNKLWFWVSSPKEWFHGLAKISSGLGRSFPSLLENWLPTPARSGSHCRGKWRQAASVSENLASLYKVQIPFQSVKSSKLIQPAQERNRIGLVCCAPHVCGRSGGWSSWQALGATSVGEPVTQEGSLTLLSVRGEQAGQDYCQIM